MIQTNIILNKRNNNELIQKNLNLDELIGMYENQKSDFHKNYSVDVEIKFDGYEYTIEDYNSEYFNEPLNKIENISKYGNELLDLQHMYNNLIRRNDIPELYDVQENELENILDYFDTEEEAREEMQNSEYNKNDEYCYYCYSTGLISFNELPYDEYNQEIFKAWLNEIIYL